MAVDLKEGDRVKVADREATADEIKNALFFNHMRGLVGTIQKVYGTENVALEVELDSTPEDAAARHLDIQEQMKTKWLDGLSEEARNRLTDKERDFQLHYTVLVPLKDVAPFDGIVPHREPKAVVPEPAPAKLEPMIEAVEPDAPESDEVEDGPVEAAIPPRRTLAEIEAAEAEELERHGHGEG